MKSSEIFLKCTLRAASRTVFDMMVEMLLSKGEVRQWLQDAQPGDRLTYFQGFLTLGTDEGGLQLSATERRQLAAITESLWQAAQLNLVDLVQRRKGPGIWTYIAVARGKLPKLAQ